MLQLARALGDARFELQLLTAHFVFGLLELLRHLIERGGRVSSSSRTPPRATRVAIAPRCKSPRRLRSGGAPGAVTLLTVISEMTSNSNSTTMLPSVSSRSARAAALAASSSALANAVRAGVDQLREHHAHRRCRLIAETQRIAARRSRIDVEDRAPCRHQGLNLSIRDRATHCFALSQQTDPADARAALTETPTRAATIGCSALRAIGTAGRCLTRSRIDTKLLDEFEQRLAG